MARPSKKGLDYYPRDTDYYDDFKIVDLMYEYGSLGQTVYDVVLTIIYKNGYFVEMPFENMVRIVIRTIGNRWADKDSVSNVILYCGNIGLLDKTLLQMNVFTSVGIQRRYNEITARNRVDKSKYWLLNKKAASDDKNAKTTVLSEETGVFAAETPVSVTETTINKIKENKIKENEIKCDYDRARANEINDEDRLYIVDKKYKAVMLSSNQQKELLDRLTLDEYNAYVEKLGAFIVDKGAHIKSHYETILKWVEEDRRKTGGKHG